MKKHKKITAAVLAAMMCMSSVGIGNILENSFKNHSITVSAATTIWDGTVDTSWYDGEEEEMHISTAEEFAGFVKLVAGGNKMEGQTIILDKDVYLNDLSEMKSDSETVPTNLWNIGNGEFSGTFDGTKHTVYGLYVKNNRLFSKINENAYVCNISICNAIVKGEDFRSLICDTNYEKISNCNVTADVTADSCALICDKNENGVISNCMSDGNIICSGSSTSSAAGICLTNNGKIENCINNANINATKNAGGIAGENTDTIISCTNNGVIQASSAVGGIASSSYQENKSDKDVYLDGCINDAEISSIGNNRGYVGGMVGIANSTYIINCINNGKVTSDSTNKSYIGGIAGYVNCVEVKNCGNNSKVAGCCSGGIIGCVWNLSGDYSYCSTTICYCYNKADICSNINDYYAAAGGLVGYNNDIHNSSCDISNCYNIGNISSNNYSGGLVGNGTCPLNTCYSYAESVEAPICGALVGRGSSSIEDYINCYYLNSGASQAVGDVTGEYGTPKSAANMKKESFAKSLGNAFVYNEGGYPMLFWEAGIPMLSIDKTELSFNELNQQDTITPDTSYDGELIWTSSDDKIATVDEDGVVTAVGNGTCTITVDAGGAKASCEVTVAYEYYLNETEITMKPDLSKELKVYSKSNDEPTSLEVKYTSSNEDVAEVNKRGVVSANAPGTAEIHAVIGGIDLICVVTVEGVKGDVNADGELTVADLVIFQKWLLADPTAKLNNWKAADLCTDNRLDVFDLVLMRRELINIKNK